MHESPLPRFFLHLINGFVGSWGFEQYIWWYAHIHWNGFRLFHIIASFCCRTAYFRKTMHFPNWYKFHLLSKNKLCINSTVCICSWKKQTRGKLIKEHILFTFFVVTNDHFHHFWHCFDCHCCRSVADLSSQTFCRNTCDLLRRYNQTDGTILQFNSVVLIFWSIWTSTTWWFWLN